MQSLLAVGLVATCAACQAVGAGERVPSAAAPHAAAAPSELNDAPGPSAGPTVVWIGGDVLLSGAIRRSVRRHGDPARGFAQLLEPVAGVWRAEGDGAFVLLNLESPVAREVRNGNDDFLRSKRGAARVPTPLNAPPWVLDGLQRAGVDGVMLANNHALDQGREGLAETIDAAHAAGLVVTGAGRAPHLGWPVVVGEGGATTAILSYFEKDFPEPSLPTGEAGLSVLGPHAVDDVRAAARSSAAVLVVVHVVAELLAEPKPAWRTWARDFAEAGAAGVFFHGTHVPGPVETMHAHGREVVVAFGLGNSVSDMGARASPARDDAGPHGKWDLAAARSGLLARVEVRDGVTRVGFLPVWMGDDRYLVRNGVASREVITFALHPLGPCGPAHALPSWPEPQRREMERWLDGRREELLAASGLRAHGCERLLRSAGH